VAAYDYTFSVPKSVSVLWGLADAGTQQIIANAHHEAVTQILAFMERELACTRIEHHRVTRQVPVEGLVTAWYDHYDSRAGDPQMHTHVILAAKARTSEDSRWRALDGRPLHAGTVAVSELYNAVLADILTRDLAIGWDTRIKGRDKNPTWEITGIPNQLWCEFIKVLGVSCSL
jgi:conjugative relaxase-like TrwC/TraI family protein